MSTAVILPLKITLPTSIAGCVVWLDGKDTSTFTFSGSAITNWRSKGSSPLVATSVGGSILYESYNSNLALRFNGTDTKMTTGSLPTYGSSATTWITCSVNLNPNTADASVVFASTAAPERAVRYTDGVNQIYTINNGTIRSSSNKTSGIRGFIDTAASFTAYVNGTDATTTTSAVTYQEGVNQTFVLGQWNIAYLNGYIQEVIVYNSALSLSQYQQVEGYLAWKWGFVSQLPANHPYKTNNLWAPVYPSLPYVLPSYASQKTQPPLPLVQQLPNRAIGVSRYYDINTPSYQIFNYTQFGSGSNISVFGNASFLNSEIQLTPNTGSQVGSAFFQRKVLINKYFKTLFSLRFENTRADGATFMIQNAASNALGATGGGVGYSNVPRSVAIVFDTYNNSEGQFSIDITTNGTVNNQGISGVLNTTLGLTAGQTWSFLVLATYNGTTLSYTITNTANGSNYSSSSNVNIPTTLGATTGWIGFSSATGGSFEGAYISAWNWSNSK